jgi:hypothetical protein
MGRVSIEGILKLVQLLSQQAHQAYQQPHWQPQAHQAHQRPRKPPRAHRAHQRDNPAISMENYANFMLQFIVASSQHLSVSEGATAAPIKPNKLIVECKGAQGAQTIYGKKAFESIGACAACVIFLQQTSQFNWQTFYNVKSFCCWLPVGCRVNFDLDF